MIVGMALWMFGSVWAGQAEDTDETPSTVPVAQSPAAQQPVPAGGGVGGGLGGVIGARPADGAAAGMPGRVHVSTTWKAPILVAEVLGQSVGRGFGYVGGQPGTTTVITTYLKDRCQTPCDLVAAPGVLNLMTYGGGALGAKAQVIVQPGASYEVQVRAQPLWTRWLALGVTTVGAALLGGGAVAGPVGLYDPTPTEVARAKATQIGLLTAGGVALGGGLGVLFGVRSRAVVTPAVEAAVTP
jgi:hypothetical protein